MAIVEIRITPVGTESTSMSQYLARAISIVKKEPDIKHQITATGTIIEGDLRRALDVAFRMHQAVLDEHVNRVETSIEIDDRKDRPETIENAVESVISKVS